MSVGDHLLEPHEAAGEAGEHPRRRAVDVRLRRPVEDQIWVTAAQQPRELDDRGERASRLAQATDLDHLDAKAVARELLRPRPVLEEDELELVPAPLGAVEDHLQHRLGAAQALTPRHRYQNSQATPP